MLDVRLLPRRPLVLTAHDLLPASRGPGQLRAQRRLLERVDAVIVHSEYGRGQLVDGLGLDGAKVHVIHHGAFAHAVSGPRAPLPPELPAGGGTAGGRWCCSPGCCARTRAWTRCCRPGAG